MAEKITEDQVNDLLKILRSEASIDAKVQHVTGIKSGIKQHNVPDVLIPQIFDGLRTASVSQHAVLVNAGFTALNHLLTRLSRQEPKYISKEAKHTLPLVIDKLGDQKEKFRGLASQALTTMYAAAPMDVERSVRNVAMVGKNPRAKEAGMHWLLHMHQEHGMQFRAYVPTLMELLEDADGMVRDVAKSTVIELFRTAPNTAKSDLKRQLKNFKVRPAIEQAIVKELAPSASSERPETPHEAPPPPVSKPKLAASVSSLASERPVTPGVEPRSDVEPAYVNTQRELDEIFREMMLYFEGKETEQNWLKREESVTKLRKLIAGNVPQDFPDAFMLGLKGLLDGIIKAVNSLRTSLSKEGCSLVQDIAVTFGPGMDPLVELLMQTFIKLSAATKKISSQLANTTVDTIIGRVTYNSRIMQHIWLACQDKNVQPRTYATGWLKTVLNKEAHHKSHIEHGGGLEMVEKSIKRGLNDANPGVRERMRATYWLFAKIWPARAELLKDTLDPTAQKLLDKDPNNPNAPKRTETERARPGLGLSKSTMSSSRPTLRETMMAQKKATMAARNLPPRPGSAMANLSPVRPQPPAASASTGSAAPAKTTVSGGMSVRPMRPTKKRPEMAARPATAGPYSVRTHDGPSAEAPSPESLKSKATPKSKTEASPRRVAPRTRPGHASHASESSVASPSAKSVLSKSVSSPRASPRNSPAKPLRSHTSIPASSPSKDNEDLTLVVPNIASLVSSSPKPVTDGIPSSAAPEEQGAPAADVQAAISVEIPLPAERMPEPTPEPEVLASPAPSLQPPAEIIPETAIEAPTEVPTVIPVEPLEDDPVKVLPEAPAADAVEATPSLSTPTKGDELQSDSTPVNGLKVFEDPFVEDQHSEKPSFTGPVLEDKPVNEIAVPVPTNGDTNGPPETPDKARQTSRLLDSGVTRVKAKSLDVHGFRKLQSILRDNKVLFTDDKFEALLRGLFEYLEAPLANLAPEKVQDVKAQILATIKLLLKKERDNFQPHVSRGLESLVETRSAYDSRTRIVSGLELLAEELVGLGDPPEIVVVMTKLLQGKQDNTVEGSRCLASGLHVLKELLDKRTGFLPSESELAQLAGLAGRCLESTDSGVRMGAVQLCVALHTRIGDGPFWELIKGAKDDPKNLITYYIAKKQRESSVAA
ncbi:heat repeat containing protein [Colletotrichum truncatum]|uniref:Heat repeat containing protein n=1 Tax=Colletotrichum truncatum TaxID=5467 RepID=A0ACC3YMQ6_COLTU|nr:heat repeat containing protein [Colletotrichum truncatum]KAF6792232.1 heat repeat containing protein [Colletotrichum truncatum]